MVMYITLYSSIFYSTKNKDKLMDLTKDSNIREDIRGCLKYTLQLDYELPPYTSMEGTPVEQYGIDLISSIMDSTSFCCSSLLKKSKMGDYDFFGLISDIYKTSSTLHMNSGNPPKGVLSLEDYMLYDCVMHCYHILLKYYTSSLSVTPYAIAMKIKDSGFQELLKNGVIEKTKYNSLRVRNVGSNVNIGDVSNFTKQYTNHIAYINKVWPNDSLPASNVPFVEANTAYMISRMSGPAIKMLYKTSVDNVSACKPKEIFDGIDLVRKGLLDSILMSKSSNNTDSLYKYYLNESSFNIDLEYTLLSSLLYSGIKNYDLTDINSLKTICSCCKLQNVFSRKVFLYYALDSINLHVDSYDDFWNLHDHSSQDNFFSSSYKYKRPSRFSYDKWLEQFELFTGYFSKFVYPIYAWCFISILLDTAERATKDYGLTHIQQIEWCLFCLNFFIENNYKHYEKLINDERLQSIIPDDAYYSKITSDAHRTFIDNFPQKREVPLINSHLFIENERNFYGNVRDKDSIIDFYIGLIKYNKILGVENDDYKPDDCDMCRMSFDVSKSKRMFNRSFSKLGFDYSHFKRPVCHSCADTIINKRLPEWYALDCSGGCNMSYDYFEQLSLYEKDNVPVKSPIKICYACFLKKKSEEI